MANLRNGLRIDNKTSKQFSYEKGDVKLNFSLRTDIKKELVDFLECMQFAIKEVQAEIDLFKKQV